MNSEFIVYLGKRTLETALLISAPALSAALIAGFLVALFQAVTSIKDMSLSMVLKLVVIGMVLLFCGSWMMQVAVGFTGEILGHIESVGQ